VAKPAPLEGAQEIQTMLVSYAKQETVEPLKSLGRYLSFGIAGSILTFMGIFFVGLGALRFFQTLEVFGGDSWASMFPYLIALALLLLSIVLIYSAMSRAKARIA